MPMRDVCLAVTILMGPIGAWAAPVKTDLHGIALGMTADQLKAGAQLPCTSLPYSSDMACKDASDGSDYHATFSAGTPSIVLSVEHSFCSHDRPEGILATLASTFRVSPGAAERDPNGYHFSPDPQTEVILNADDGTCPDGRGKHYVALIRGDGLIQAGSKQALERVKKVLR